MIKIFLLTFIAPFILADAIGRGVTPTAVPVSVAVPVPTPISGEINIEGIDEENMKKLNEEIKDVKEPEERKEKIDDWIEDLPEDQQPIAKQYFQNMEQNANAAPIPPLTPVAGHVM